MTDVEQLLRESLNAYANSIDPSPRPDLTRSAVVTRRRLLGSAAAVAGAVAGVGGLWWLRSRRRDAAAVGAGPGRWTVPSASPLSPRQFPSVMWTGREFLVWGGVVVNTGLADGARYDPVADAWRPIAPAPAVRPGAPAVWAADRMVVVSPDGAHTYDPVTERWSTFVAFDGPDGPTDVVWTGSVVLGVGVRRLDDGGSVLTAWRFDDAGWTDLGSITGETAPTVRYSTTTDRREVHEVVALADGCALWDGTATGWRFVVDVGWRRLPTLDTRGAEGELITDPRLVVVDGDLTVVAEGRTAEADDLRVARLDGDDWGTWTVLPTRAVVFVHRLAPVRGGFVVLGASTDQPGAPVLVDVVDDTTVVMNDYPIDTVLDQGTGWSGSQLLVVGGQRATDGSVQSTGSNDTVSAAVALWTADN